MTLVCLIPCKVSSEWQEVLGCFDKSIDATLKETIQATIAKARVTKCSGVCLSVLKEMENKDELRAVVRGEIQELRKHGVDEKLTIHPVLLKNMNLALAMRF
eukprot:6492445-Amphidinium_carterae.7